jgi:hypothetical protein
MFNSTDFAPNTGIKNVNVFVAHSQPWRVPVTSFSLYAGNSWADVMKSDVGEFYKTLASQFGSYSDHNLNELQLKT